MINKITQELKTKGFNLEVAKEYNEKICRIKHFNLNEVNPKSSIELDEELFISKIIVRNYINNATLIYVNEEKQNEVNKERNREYDY